MQQVDSLLFPHVVSWLPSLDECAGRCCSSPLGAAASLLPIAVVVPQWQFRKVFTLAGNCEGQAPCPDPTVAKDQWGLAKEICSGLSMRELDSLIAFYIPLDGYWLADA